MSRVYSTFPENYELIDAGAGRKLERWGDVITIRPENLAYFQPTLAPDAWKNLAHWEFLPDTASAGKIGPASLKGKWVALKPAATQWDFRTDELAFQLEITSNKHIGLFPEQAYNWRFIRSELKPGSRFLNLFAYTGAASLFGRMTGAEVVHVDSVRAMLDWASKNMEKSSLSDIKWVLEDARKFVNRERKRGNRYNLIQMDPPAWGLGAKGEKWRIEDLLPDLIHEALELLLPGGTLIVNTYSPKIRPEDLQAMLPQDGFSGEVHELWMETTHGKHLHYGLLARIRRQ